MHRLVEDWYPAVGAIVASGAYLWFDASRTYILPDTVPQLLAAVVSVGGIAIGFLATAKSILLAIDDRPVIQRIKKAPGLYSKVLAYLRAAIRWSFLLTLVSVVLLLVRYQGLSSWDWQHAAGTAAWLFLAVGAVLSYCRVWHAMYLILDFLDTPAP